MSASEQMPFSPVKPIVPIGWALLYWFVWFLFISIAPDFLGLSYLMLIFMGYQGLVWQQFLGQYRERNPRLVVGLRFFLSAFSFITLYLATSGPR